MPVFRTLAGALAATMLVACVAGAAPADARLCGEVERVIRELDDVEPPISDTDLPLQEHKILASHLMVAADGGGSDGRPDPELATVVRETGWRGTSRSGPEFVAALEGSFAACEEAGVEMDEDALRALTSLA